MTQIHVRYGRLPIEKIIGKKKESWIWMLHSKGILQDTVKSINTECKNTKEYKGYIVSILDSLPPELVSKSQ